MLFLGNMLLVILMVKKIVETFSEKELQNAMQRQFKFGQSNKVIRRNDDKLYVKRKGYDNYFNSQIDKKDIVT